MPVDDFIALEVAMDRPRIHRAPADFDRGEVIKFIDVEIGWGRFRDVLS